MHKWCIIYLLIAPIKKYDFFPFGIESSQSENKQGWLNFLEASGKLTAPQKHLLW